MVVGGGFHAVDLILIGMAGALIFRLLNTAMSKRSNYTKINYLSFLISIFALLILFEIVRNIPQYGLSALGEFRFYYLILIIPLYIS